MKTQKTERAHTEKNSTIKHKKIMKIPKLHLKKETIPNGFTDSMRVYVTRVGIQICTTKSTDHTIHTNEIARTKKKQR